MSAANDDHPRAPTVPTIANGCVIERPILHPNGLGELNEQDAALYCGRSTKTMYNMRTRGTGPEFVMRLGRPWYPMDKLDAFLAKEASRSNAA